MQTLPPPKKIRYQTEILGLGSLWDQNSQSLSLQSAGSSLTTLSIWSRSSVRQSDLEKERRRDETRRGEATKIDCLVQKSKNPPSSQPMHDAHSLSLTYYKGSSFIVPTEEQDPCSDCLSLSLCLSQDHDCGASFLWRPTQIMVPSS